MSKADDLRLVWQEKARVARDVANLWMAAPAKTCQENNELIERAAYAFDERHAAWKAYVAAEWNAIRAESGMEDE